MSRMLRLSKGFIPIQIDYFEATGDSALGLYIEESGVNAHPQKIFSTMKLPAERI